MATFTGKKMARKKQSKDGVELVDGRRDVPKMGGAQQMEQRGGEAMDGN